MVRANIILASNSPRRNELFQLTGWSFEIKPANIDETPLPDEAPGPYVLRLAETKARIVGREAAPEQVVLAADTTVADDRILLGKPADAAEAIAMLARLRGKVHQVYTALAVFDPLSGRIEKDLCTSQVPMRRYGKDEVLAYVSSGDPLDKAGAYAIQHPGFHPVEHFSGCFASVMGLPLCHVTRTLQKFGFSPARDVPQACQAHLAYQCPIYQAVLRGEDVG
jgi:septum formation protein